MTTELPLKQLMRSISPTPSSHSWEPLFWAFRYSCTLSLNAPFCLLHSTRFCFLLALTPKLNSLLPRPLPFSPLFSSIFCLFLPFSSILLVFLFSSSSINRLYILSHLPSFLLRLRLRYQASPQPAIYLRCHLCTLKSFAPRRSSRSPSQTRQI
ncbi:hypothetical protein HDV57DRAFT_503706 [Trichoderma longibrachiatum]